MAIDTNQPITQMLNAFSAVPIKTIEQFQEALMRCYEVKGRAIKRFSQAMHSTNQKDISWFIHDGLDFTDISPYKQLSNLKRGAGFRATVEQLFQIYSRIDILFQQMLKSMVAQGNGFEGTAYRFGPINECYDGSNLVASQQFTSSASKGLLMIPSYFERTTQDGVLRAYKIRANKKGINIGKVTDKYLNGKPFETGEVVFPQGTSFQKTRVSDYTIDQDQAVEIDSFQEESTGFRFVAHIQATSTKDSPKTTITLPLIFKLTTSSRDAIIPILSAKSKQQRHIKVQLRTLPLFNPFNRSRYIKNNHIQLDRIQIVEIAAK